MAKAGSPKTTSLHDVHVELGAKMIDFSGWQMPVQYGSILEEVSCVRQKVGLFDLGHMGRLCISGPDAVTFLDRVATNYCERIPEGAIRYSLLCKEDGGVIDDVLVYREAKRFFVVVNAVNTEKDLEWLRTHSAGLDVEVRDLTAELAMLALQGQCSQAVLQKVTDDCDLSEIGYYKFAFGTICRLANVRISRTGYTGEDGFEIYFPTSAAARVWKALMEAGAEEGLRPIGLGARDILRLEAGMPLYGHEIDEEHNPIEAGLGFAVSFREPKGDFVGREALARIKDKPRRKLVGLTTPGPRVPRQGQALFKGEEQVGSVCSGALSPTLDTKIATAYVSLGWDRADEKLELDVRGKRQACAVQSLPFYSRTRK